MRAVKKAKPDKFSSTWVSHSSISDFLSCPRGYYLNNIYRNPKTGHKIQLMSPSLALGSAVHNVIEALSTIETKDRFRESLIEKFQKAWKKVTGKKGGFTNEATEQRFKQEGEEMLRMVMENPGPLENLAVKIKQDLPYYFLSEEDAIILCGKVDWLEYLPDSDSVHVIDFKTGKNEERPGSLQLPIYHLLVHNTQEREVSKASYWYLRKDKKPKEQILPNLQEAHEQILQIAKKIKLQRQLNVFKCPNGESGCRSCTPLERVARGEAEMVGVSEYGQDIFILPWDNEESKTSEIL